MKAITVQERVAELVRAYGSHQKAADAIGLSKQYLWEIGSGMDRAQNLTISTLRKIGLKVGPKFEKA